MGASFVASIAPGRSYDARLESSRLSRSYTAPVSAVARRDIPYHPRMPVDVRPPAIALMGPTASGKTALALEWAERFGGEIVSVDSALVYRGLDIGAAKPDAVERARRAAPPARPARSVAAVFGGGIRRRCARRHRRHRRARQAADPGRRHRPVFPRAAAGPVADAGGRSRACAPPSRPRRPSAAGRSCTHELARIDPSRRRAHPRHRRATHPARAGSVPPQRQADQRVAARIAGDAARCRAAC